MNVIKSRFVYHLMAIITVAIWGTTFVSTKILIQHGLSPSDIFFYRFTLAYLCMWCISYKKLFANRVKDELLLLLAGLCGGTIYFITENTALGITLASNVSLIVCTSP
ncbi:EamA family transporter, partial [Phocaeicola vulgatus]